MQPLSPAEPGIAREADTPSLRLWPGVVLVAIQWFVRFVVPLLVPAALPYAVLAGLLGGLLVVIWWTFFSRAPRIERWLGLALIVAGLVVPSFFLHESLATGMMGALFVIYAAPTLSLAVVLWAALSRPLSTRGRLVSLALALVIACGGWLLVRTEGVTGAARSQFAWRFAPTLEERTLEQLSERAPAEMAHSVATPAQSPPTEPASTEPAPTEPAPDDSEVIEAASIETASIEPAPAEATPSAAIDTPSPNRAAWPGFRGPNRDGVAQASTIRTEWATRPPVELWRRPIGPGWSSFALQGDRLYTQEQRGDDEVITCYRASTGEPLWQHADAVRFWESNAGAGPRSTPTLHEGRVYALGATGLLNALDAATGRVLWTRDVTTDTGAKLPMWGFSGSPLVTGDRVISAASGAIVAYDRATGEPRWTVDGGGDDYSSPQLLSIDGIEQVVLMNSDGATSYAPANGSKLWHHPLPRSSRIVQPAQMPNGDLLVSQGSSQGLRRLRLTRETGGWKVTELWATNRLKPYFSDFVVHEDHAYGFDGSILAAIDLATGERVWKGGRYGDGQLVLVPEQDLLLVLSESGDLVLVAARPEGFEEIAKFQTLEGKTWNHPVLVGAQLWVRNGQEMAAFDVGG